MTGDPMLSVQALSVRYLTPMGSKSALRDVSFNIARGEALGLVGESGSGKSTVALSILGLGATNARMQCNSIAFEGEDIFHAPEARRSILRGDRIGTVFQDPFTSLNPSLLIGAQIAEPLVHHKHWTKRDALARATELLDEVGIHDPRRVSASYPHQLSGGMQQRALIATALACEPDLLILDEPTTALDVTVEAQILDLMSDLRRKRGLSILFVTHNLGAVRRLCDSVSVLYAGELVEHGPVSQVLSAPLHPYTKGLLVSAPRIGSDHARRLPSIPGKIPDRPEDVEGCIFQARCVFSEARCAEPQSIVETHPARLARCWKAGELASTSWPQVEDTRLPQATVANNQVIIETHALCKTFELGGPMAFTLDRRPGGWPRLVSSGRSVRAVDTISLNIRRGEILGVVGESGSGKSTLGRLMLRLMEPTSGRVLLGGKDILAMPGAELRNARGKMQIILQNPDSSLNPRKTVAEIIGRSVVRFQDVKGPDLERQIARLLDKVGLPASYLQRYPHQLSGGEKQRVGIARALAPSPDLIVCDEAVSALDVSLQATILNLLLDLRDEMGVAYVFISHDLAATSFVSDRIAVMNKGRIVEIGTTREILQPPYHPYTFKLLSTAPHFAESAVLHPNGGEPVAGTGDVPINNTSGHWISAERDLV